MISQPCLNKGLTLRRRSSTISHILSLSPACPPSVTFHPSDVTCITNLSPSKVVRARELVCISDRDEKRELYVEWRCSYSREVSNEARSLLNAGRGMQVFNDARQKVLKI